MHKGLTVFVVVTVIGSLALSLWAVVLTQQEAMQEYRPVYDEPATEEPQSLRRYTSSGQLILEFDPGFRPRWRWLNGDLTINGVFYRHGTWEHLYYVDTSAIYYGDPYPSAPIQDLDPDSPTFGQFFDDIRK